MGKASAKAYRHRLEKARQNLPKRKAELVEDAEPAVHIGTGIDDTPLPVPKRRKAPKPKPRPKQDPVLYAEPPRFAGLYVSPSSVRAAERQMDMRFPEYMQTDKLHRTVEDVKKQRDKTRGYAEPVKDPLDW